MGARLVRGTMRSVCILTISLALALVVSCTRSNHPADEVGGTSAPPSSIPSDRGDLDDALVAAGVDADRVPERLGDLGDRPFCGSDVRAEGEAGLSQPARCFLDRSLAEVDAVYVTTYPTTEGDPITTVYVAGRDGRVSVFTDMTRDSYGSGEWAREDARRVAVASSLGAARIDLIDLVEVDPDSTLPRSVNEELPGWFIERQPLRWCGMDVRTADQNLEARQCFRDAVERGDPAEYAVGQTGDEGERGIAWFRVLGSDDIEVIERSLPGSGSAAPGPPAWRRLRCNQVNFWIESGSEVDLVPCADDPGSCTAQ